MKIELKNIKRAAFASQETHCFEATVYIDGKRSGTVSNEGYGGCNLYYPQALAERVEAHARTLAPIETPYGAFSVDADLLINELLEQTLKAKEEKRLCKRGTLVRFEGVQYKGGAWELFNTPYFEGVIARIEKLEGKRIADCLNQRVGA